MTTPCRCLLTTAVEPRLMILVVESRLGERYRVVELLRGRKRGGKKCNIGSNVADKTDAHLRKTICIPSVQIALATIARGG